MLRALLTIAGLLAAVIALVVIIGYALPVAHVASRDGVIAAPPDRVFALIADVERYPSWRSGVASVDVVSRTPRLRWIETDRSGDTITFEVVEAHPPSKRVTRIADPSLPFGGTWICELRPEGSGTRIVVTERGEVYNPVFRFMSRFVFGHTATMEAFLKDVSARAASS
jgi:uncharacterized protein YndB with AHSA1/START domain